MIARNRAIALGAGGAALLAAIVLAGSLWDRGGCGSRDDVEARVARVSSLLQSAAGQGKIKVEDLASRIRRLNEGAAAYAASKDHQAYCDALDTLEQEIEAEP
jgi:hypothetical protein